MELKPNHFNKDWLYDQYINKGLSTYEIGKIVNRDPSRIHEKLKQFNIPSRPRGFNLSKNGKNNYMKLGKGNPFQGKSHSEKTKEIMSEKASCPKPWLRGENNGMFGRIAETNPNYKNGMSPERQRIYASAKWHELKRQIFQRDRNQCKRCGKKKDNPKGIQTHHIKSWTKYPNSRFVISNIVVLCKNCHEFIHSNRNVNKEFIFADL